MGVHIHIYICIYVYIYIYIKTCAEIFIWLAALAVLVVLLRALPLLACFACVPGGAPEANLPRESVSLYKAQEPLPHLSARELLISE